MISLQIARLIGLLIQVGRQDAGIFEFRLFDWDMGKDEESMGVVTLSLRDLPTAEEEDHPRWSPTFSKPVL